MRKGRDGEKNWKNGKKTGKKKTDENSGHYVVCQQSTTRTTLPAGTQHARANLSFAVLVKIVVRCFDPLQQMSCPSLYVT